LKGDSGRRYIELGERVERKDEIGMAKMVSCQRIGVSRHSLIKVILSTINTMHLRYHENFRFH